MPIIDPRESLEVALEGLDAITPITDYVPEGHTVVFDAPQRRGKTLAAVVLAFDSWRDGRDIFSNIKLGFPHAPLEFDELVLADGKSKYRGGHIFVDELNFFYDCRKSMSKDNRRFGAFLLQQKKQGCHLTGTTHSVDYLDLRFRQNYDIHIEPTVYPAYPRRPEILKLRITNGPLQAPFEKVIKLRCEDFLGLYDSSAVYDPFRKKVPTPPAAPAPAAHHPGSRGSLL